MTEKERDANKSGYVAGPPTIDGLTWGTVVEDLVRRVEPLEHIGIEVVEMWGSRAAVPPLHAVVKLQSGHWIAAEMPHKPEEVVARGVYLGERLVARVKP